ncbi:MAG: DUF4136 domain-containing protein [Gammaproteobacteria bacterium]|nr:DUF4136 domain-containing protein [Gammaproteobacteria bacterium]
MPAGSCLEATLMVKQLLRFALLVPALAGLPACTLYVRSDVNKALIGSVHCGSFAWAGSFHGNSALRGTIANPVNENRLRTAIAAHLQGGVQATPANADCLVGYGIGSTTVVDGVWPYDWGWGYYGWGWGGPWPGPYAYTQGIIAVDLYDAKSRQPLWHASVDQSLYGASGADADKRIDAAVAAIFSKYPG